MSEEESPLDKYAKDYTPKLPFGDLLKTNPTVSKAFTLKPRNPVDTFDYMTAHGYKLNLITGLYEFK